MADEACQARRGMGQFDSGALRAMDVSVQRDARDRFCNADSEDQYKGQTRPTLGLDFNAIFSLPPSRFSVAALFRQPVPLSLSRPLFFSLSVRCARFMVLVAS